MHDVKLAYCPESNGAEERLNRTFLDMARSLFSNLENKLLGLWAEKINMECYRRNRLVKKRCRMDCRPFDVINRRQKNQGHVKLFGVRPVSTISNTRGKKSMCE